jgi:hypothetical protein
MGNDPSVRPRSPGADRGRIERIASRSGHAPTGTDQDRTRADQDRTERSPDIPLALSRLRHEWKQNVRVFAFSYFSLHARAAPTRPVERSEHRTSPVVPQAACVVPGAFHPFGTVPCYARAARGLVKAWAGL